MYLKEELSEIFNGDNYSKIISMHKYARVGCSAYGNVVQSVGEVKKANTINSHEEVKLANNFYNVIDCSDVAMNDEDTAEVITNILSLVNSGNHFMPVVEVAREYSNLVFVIPTTINYSNNTYRFNDEDGLCEFMRSLCKKLYKKMSVKTTVNVLMYIRCYKKKVYFKVHLLDYVMDISNRVALMKLVNKQIVEVPSFTEAYPIMYNEFYETSTLPLVQSGKDHYYWQLYRIFECRKSYNISISNIDKVVFMERLTTNPDISPLVLSINNYTGKEMYYRDVPIYTMESKSFNEDVILLREINNNIRIGFFNLVLKYLPDEYKEGVHMENIVMSLKLIDQKCLLLAKHYYMKSANATEEGFYSIWSRVRKVSMMGYYANIVAVDKEYIGALKSFIAKEIEKEYYNRGGSVVDTTLATLINCYFYGRYYSFEVMQKAGSNKIRMYEFVDEYSDASEEYLYKWREASASGKIYRFMVEDLDPIFGIVSDKLGIADANSRSKDAKEKALGKMATAFNASKKKLTGAVGINSIYRLFKEQEINNGLFAFKINADKGVIGVHNGILDLDLDSDDPKPKLYTGYSPFVVTKSVNARWVPYEKVKCAGKYIRLIKNAIKDIIPEKDARRKILYVISTALDEKSQKMFLLMLIGWGSNGKSLIFDTILCLLFMYGIKLSTKLITSDRIGGAADPELMKMKGHRFGLIAETNKNDKLIASRVKQITEKVKDGRDLFQDSENFDTKSTIIVNSNYELNLDDTDHGTTRRLMIYRNKIRFVYNPDPTDENEKKIDPSLPDIFTCDEALTELFSWLVHLRCKFHRLYKSDIFNVESETIDRYTNEYKCNQDNITKFIHQRLVIMKGFKMDGKLRQGETLDSIARYYDEKNIQFVEKLKMESVTREYVEWMKAINGVTITDGFNSLLNSFKNSCISKRIISDGELAYMNGIRIIERGEVKREGEVHIN